MNPPTVRTISCMDTCNYYPPRDDGEPPAKRHQFDPKSPLCRRCQPLDLAEKFTTVAKVFKEVRDGKRNFPREVQGPSHGPWFYNDAIMAYYFEDSLLRETDCPLCKFFQSVMVDAGACKRHKLLAFCSSDHWLFMADWLRKDRGDDMSDSIDTVFMAVVPDPNNIPPCGYDEEWIDEEIASTGAIYRLAPGEANRADGVSRILQARELEATANLKGARDLLGMCQQDHGGYCKQRTSQEPISHGFRLIDCSQTPPIVETQAWGLPYVALSYVWGSTAEDLIDWPATVLDAVEVVNKLGYRYLWVDRLCINQSDTAEKAYLISRMTTIYEAAELTIIGAAGDGASHGLPGVRTTPRNPQPKYHLDDGSVLLSMLRDPRRDILESAYWTRGWTYQEGMLSNRRLVFTENQMYWECRNMSVHESIDAMLYHMPVSKEPGEKLGVMADFMVGGIFKGQAFSGLAGPNVERSLHTQDDHNRLMTYGYPSEIAITVGEQLRGLNEHIREFSRRKLSRDSDVLLAIQGIFGLYASSTDLHLLHGLPIWTGTILRFRSGSHVTFALSVSSWYHRRGSEQAMYVAEAARRRNCLPSWTWAGWDATVSWRAPPDAEHGSYMRDLINADSLNLLWVANMSLKSNEDVHPIHLADHNSTTRLRRESPTILEIHSPFVLNQFQRVAESDKEWSWTAAPGRLGRQGERKKPISWDATWYRIGRRLSCTGMSIDITQQQWTAMHERGELVSVLIFAGKHIRNEHGTARFLTLRRLRSSDRRLDTWERVGTLYLIIPFNASCPNLQAFSRKIPAAYDRRTFVVQ